MIKIRIKISKIENSKIQNQWNQKLILYKINKINETLVRLTKKKGNKCIQLKSEWKWGYYYWSYKKQEGLWENMTKDYTWII